MEDRTLTREIDGLREQLQAGELSSEDYALLRERLVLRAAAPESSAGAGPGRRRGQGALWAAGGLVAVAIVLAALVPAIRDRGPGDYSTGNDFGEARSQLDSGVREWRAAERARAAGDRRQAVRRYRLAVAFLPERGDVRAQFGFTLAQTGRRTEALRQLRLAVRAAPRLPEARLYLGAVLAQAGRREDAARHWRRYLALAPDGPSAAVVRRELAGR